MNLEIVKLKIAKALTSWMNSKKQEPLPDWDALPEAVKRAYLEQAELALKACNYEEIVKESYEVLNLHDHNLNFPGESYAALRRALNIE